MENGERCCDDDDDDLAAEIWKVRRLTSLFRVLRKQPRQAAALQFAAAGNQRSVTCVLCDTKTEEKGEFMDSKVTHAHIDVVQVVKGLQRLRAFDYKCVCVCVPLVTFHNESV